MSGRFGALHITSGAITIAMRHRSIDVNERATEKPVHIPTVLAVGCSDVLLQRCWAALAPMGVMVRDCELALLPTLVSSRMPLAIVMPEHVYARDPVELDALARDVRAMLVKIHAEATVGEIEAVVGVAIRSTRRRREGRDSVPALRTSLLPGECFATSFGCSFAPPPGASEPPVSGVRGGNPELEALEEELLAALR
jgi:hypothetical protein